MKSPILAVLAILVGGTAHAQTADGSWVQTFELSPAAYTMQIQLPKNPPKQDERLVAKIPIQGTLRYRFAVSAGGQRFRVRVSNETSAEPLHIAAASIALAAEGFNVNPVTLRRLTFNGKEDIRIPAGSPAISDPVELSIRPLSELVASFEVDQEIPAQPLSGANLQCSAGDQVMAPAFDGPLTVTLRPLISGVLVPSKAKLHVIVGFGDSLTDGVRSKPDLPHGWVDRLARRVVPIAPDTAFVTAGIGGNRVLRDGWGPSALARADRDAFAVPGVTDIILLEGINDIGMSGQTMFGSEPVLQVDELLAGYMQIAVRAHLRGLKIYIGTLMPFRGSVYFSEEKEKMRLAVNAWVRSNHAFDGVVDFDKALRDPNAPDQLNKAFDSGDHIHPSDDGYKAMSTAVPLMFLK